MLPLLTASFLAVSRIFAVCLVGYWLARKGVLDAAGRTKLSRVILWALLPALLFAKLGRNASLDNLRQWATLPGIALLYVGIGFALGALLRRLARAPAAAGRGVTAASAFGNSGYIPIPLVAAVAATSPLFRQDPGAAGRGIAYISVYLTAMSPALWGIGYPYLSGRNPREISWNQWLSPPVAGSLLGILVGASPAFRRFLIVPGAPLGVIRDAAELLGAGAIPCSLLVLGANVAAAGAAGRDSVAWRPVLGVAVTRLLVFPFIGIAVMLALRTLHLIPRDPMFALVLMIEAAVPPATNLIVMCQLHERGENAMARILFWTYLAAAPVLTLFLGLFLWIIQRLQ